MSIPSQGPARGPAPRSPLLWASAPFKLRLIQPKACLNQFDRATNCVQINFKLEFSNMGNN